MGRWSISDSGKIGRYIADGSYEGIGLLETVKMLNECEDLREKDGKVAKRLDALEAELHRQGDFIADLLQKKLDTRALAKRVEACERSIGQHDEWHANHPRVIAEHPIIPPAQEKPIIETYTPEDYCTGHACDLYQSPPPHCQHYDEGYCRLKWERHSKPAPQKPPEPHGDEYHKVQCGRCGLVLNAPRVKSVDGTHFLSVHPCENCEPAEEAVKKHRETIEKMRDEIWELGRQCANNVCAKCGGPIKPPEPASDHAMEDEDEQAWNEAANEAPRIECGRCGKPLKAYRPSHDAWCVNPWQHECMPTSQKPQEPASESAAIKAQSTTEQHTDYATVKTWWDGETFRVQLKRAPEPAREKVSTGNIHSDMQKIVEDHEALIQLFVIHETVTKELVTKKDLDALAAKVDAVVAKVDAFYADGMKETKAGWGAFHLDQKMDKEQILGKLDMLYSEIRCANEERKGVDALSAKVEEVAMRISRMGDDLCSSFQALRDHDIRQDAKIDDFRVLWDQQEAEAHREVMKAVDALHRALGLEEPGGSLADWMREMVRDIGALREEMREHSRTIQSEMSCDYYDFDKKIDEQFKALREEMEKAQICHCGIDWSPGTGHNFDGTNSAPITIPMSEMQKAMVPPPQTGTGVQPPAVEGKQ